MNEEEMRKAKAMTQRIGQDVMHMFSLLEGCYPNALRPFVLATIQAGINSELVEMSEPDKEWFQDMLKNTTVVTVPNELAKMMMEMDRE